MFTDDQGITRETPDEIGIERKLDMILDELRGVRTAFPKNEDGTPDYEGHRRYHESLIKAAKAEEEFWTDLKKEVAKKGIIAVLVIVCGLLWLGAQVKLGIAPH